MILNTYRKKKDNPKQPWYKWGSLFCPYYKLWVRLCYNSFPERCKCALYAGFATPVSPCGLVPTLPSKQRDEASKTVGNVLGRAVQHISGPQKAGRKGRPPVRCAFFLSGPFYMLVTMLVKHLIHILNPTEKPKITVKSTSLMIQAFLTQGKFELPPLPFPTG